MILKDTIFRAYDIRGEAFVDFDEDGFFVIAESFGRYIQQKHDIQQPRVFVSGDGRISLEELWPAVVAGLESVGCVVSWGGVLPTPINYFAFHEGDFDASIQISASHNPAKDNGLKLVDREGAVCGEEIQKIKALTKCSECRKTDDFGACADGCHRQSFDQAYSQKLLAIVPAHQACQVVVDAGNGVAGVYFPDIFHAFGHEVVELYCDLDTTFPNHQPDPERPENMKDLQAKVQEVGADFGFGFDGDGDRVGVVLRDGTILSADQILYVLAADYLSRNPGETVVVDAMTSATLIEKIQALGGKVQMAPTGHSYIEVAMKSSGARLAGEQSGHFMFGENFYGHDDAMLASLRFLAAVETDAALLKAVTTEWPLLKEYSEKLKVSDEEKFSILERFKELLREELDEEAQGELSFLDGARLDWGDGEWAIVRCSNTSPKIAVRIEARDAERLDEKKEWLLGLLQKAKGVV